MSLTSGLFDDDTLRWHLQAMVQERIDAQREPRGHVAVMVYPQYRPVDAKAVANELWDLHRPLTATDNTVDRMASANEAAYRICDIVTPHEFAHVALCGHGDRGALVMRDGSRLSPRTIGTVLAARKFKGRLLLTLNMCGAGFADVNASNMWQRAPRTDDVAWPADAGFECTVIAISDGAVVNTNATHFARLLQRVVDQVRLGDIGDASFIQRTVDATWRDTRDPNEAAQHWIPPPSVTHHLANPPSHREAARRAASVRATIAAFEPSDQQTQTTARRGILWRLTACVRGSD